MPPPDNTAQLRSFLGLISHYSSFVPEMHRLRGPLNDLLTKDRLWTWSHQCQAAFDGIKSVLCSDLLLTHFNPELEIVVASDASDYGIGAVISHIFPDKSEKAIAHAARSLTPAERNYGQIEKEALAIVFAVKRFHKMLYGHHFTLLTDHKPLLAIFGSKKGIPAYTANRLQRWATILLAYDFNIKYQSTHSIGQADALSRLIKAQSNEPEEVVIAQVSSESEILQLVSDSFRALPVTFNMVKNATLEDPILQQVMRYHRDGWPKKIANSELQQFLRRKEALSVVNGCLLFSDRIVVPESLQKRVLKQFHTGHPGTSRMKALTRSYVYWPYMDSQIEELTRRCAGCANASKQPRKTEPCPWPHPTKPWSRLHVDFAGPIDGYQFLIVVDAYSKWPEVIPMTTTTARATVAKLRQVFCRFGAPHTLVSDNGRKFTSSEFAEFCQQNAIDHVRSPPFHPQSNGQAERFVDTFKRALLKMEGEGTLAEIIDTFLITYRSTPNPQAPNGVSPAEALMQRKLRTSFDAIKPQTLKPEQQDGGQSNHARRFAVGQQVLARDYRRDRPKWTIGRVLRKHGNVIYDIEVGTTTWVRHANQLLNREVDNASSIDRTPDSRIPFNLLTDENASQPTGTTSTFQQTESPQHSPKRRPSRQRKPVSTLQINPRLKTYV